MTSDTSPDGGTETAGVDDTGSSAADGAASDHPGDTGSESSTETVVEGDVSTLGAYLRGFAMGTADGVPGVSGGTIALITGIYDRLVAAVSAVDPSLARRLLADLGRGSDAVVETLRDADVPFLLTLGAGLVTAVLIVVPLVNTALTTAPAITFGAFFGLIAASVWVLRDAVAVDETRGVVAFLAAAVIAGVASGSARAALSGSLPATFLAGALAVSAMLLPGISGSLILVILGQYERMSGALKELLTAVSTVATGGSAPDLVATAVTVAVFVTGGVVGLLSVARVVRAALARDRRTTTTFLVGLVVGALRAPVAGTTTALAEAGRSWTPTVVGSFLVAAVGGAVVVLALDRLAGDVDI